MTLFLGDRQFVFSQLNLGMSVGSVRAGMNKFLSL